MDNARTCQALTVAFLPASSLVFPARHSFADVVHWRQIVYTQQEAFIVLSLMVCMSKRRGRMLAMEDKRRRKRTHQRRIDGNAALSAAVLQQLIDAIPLPIFYKDIRGVYLGGNRAFEDFLGKKLKDIVGKTVRDLAPPDLAALYEQADQALLEKDGRQSFESAVMHADGTRHRVVFDTAVLKQSDGTPSGLIGSIFDITLRKQFEEQLRGSEARYRRIFESIQDIYYELGLDGAILEISPSVEKYTSLKREAFLGRSIAEFYPDKGKRRDFLRALKAKGYLHDFEIQLRDRQDNVSTWSIAASLLPAEGDYPPRIVGSLRNISRRKTDEEKLKQSEEELSIKSRNLEEVNAALKVLLRQREEDRRELEENVLANVKTSLFPHIDKLKEEGLNPRQRCRVEMIEEALKKIVSPFLNRISRACLDLTPQEIHVADFVKQGKTTKEIASLLGISNKTVDYHRDNLRRKLGLKNHRVNLRSYLLRLS